MILQTHIHQIEVPHLKVPLIVVDRFQDYDPSTKLKSGGGPFHNSASLEAFKTNEVPDKKDWNVNE